MVEDDGDTLEGHIDVEVGAYSLIVRLIRGFEPGKPFHSALAPDGGVVVYRRDDSVPRFFGTGQLKDVGRVAVGTSGKARKGRDCGPYVSLEGRGAMMATRIDHDVEVKLYDARTGAEIGSKTFSSRKLECPSGATSVDSEKPVVDLYPDPREVAAWTEKLQR